MTGFMLQPMNGKIEFGGKVSYHENSQAFNTIRLKKIILDQFPQLKDKQAAIKYKIEFYRSYEQLLETIDKMQKKKSGIPLLLYLFQE